MNPEQREEIKAEVEEELQLQPEELEQLAREAQREKEEAEE